MNFSARIPRATQPRFAEGSGLASVRDSRNNSLLWKKARDVTQQQNGFGQAIQSIARDLQRLRKRQTGYILGTELSHPFKIYQPSNVTQFTQGVTFLGNDGTPTLCNIDSTKPTDFTATPPTVNPSTDAWRFWTVRCGQVGVRFNYTQMENTTYYGAAPFYDFMEVAGNWEARYNVQVYTDGHAPCYDSVDFDNPTTAVRLGFPASVPIIISQTPAGSNHVRFGIWINIVPDASSDALPTALICGNGILSSASAPNPFPTYGPNSIPIGIINYYGLGNFGDGNSSNSVDQMVFDHVCNRFPTGAGNWQNVFPPPFGSAGLGSSVMNFRGAWDGRSNFMPADLGSQFFYPGDVIAMYQSGVGVVTFRMLIGNKPIPFDLSGGNWGVIFSIQGVAGTWPY